jgi:molecular chaperone DnaK
MYLGIDFGTSNSVIAGIVDGKVNVFRPVDGGDVLPTVIYFDKRGHRLYGRRAYDQAMLSPDSVAMGFKRLIGTSTPIQIPAVGLSLTPEECCAEILRQLLGQAATETGDTTIHGAVITVPAAFNQLQREATMRAAALAGLKNVTLLQEPIAAAMSALGTERLSGQFLIYDLGGGTFDLALVESISGKINVIAHEGINMLGGRDFDRLLVNGVIRPWLIDNFDLPENFQRDKQYHRLIRVAQLAAERAKIDLSTLEETKIFASEDEVRLVDGSGTDIFLDAPVTRAQYEELIQAPVMQTVELARQVMEENNYRHDDLDRLIFIGGPSRTPLIRERVAQELGLPTDLSVDPLTAVAIGAAHYATVYDWGGQKPQADTSVNISAATKAPSAAPAMEAKSSAAAERKPAAAKTEPEAKIEDAPPQMGDKDGPVKLDYATPTGDSEIYVYLQGTSNLGEATAIQIEASDGWASEIVDISPDAEIKIPVKKLGANDYRLRYFDKRDRELDQYDQRFTVTRSDVAMPKIPATQTISIKALDQVGGKTNILVPLVSKGMLLPARGKAQFKTAREIISGSAASLSFELFQVDYPEKIELNLCVGVFRISGHDLPVKYQLRVGDPIIFNWKMLESGILQATVTLPQPAGRAALELQAPRFYAPQASEMNFNAEQGGRFVAAVLRQAEEELGEAGAAIGPEGIKALTPLKLRLRDQQIHLQEAGQEPELIRKISEEARMIRQDIARASKAYQAEIAQRQLGKLKAFFNRLAREKAEPEEIEKFEKQCGLLQKAIERNDAAMPAEIEEAFFKLREIFFAAAWRDDKYVMMWFERLQDESYLYPDLIGFQRLVQEGKERQQAKDMEQLRNIVSQLLESRIALAASDMTTEPASIVKG